MKNNLEKVIITGGAGFIGSNLAEHLFKNGTKEILNSEVSDSNFLNLVHEIIEKVEIILIKSNKGLKMIEPWSLRKETLIILNIAKRLCYLLKVNDVLRKNVKLSRIDLIFCFIKGIMI